MKTLSQCDRVLQVLVDGEAHTIEEIHRRAGTMRLNSRVAELRKRGLTIKCTCRAGIYSYQLHSLSPSGKPNDWGRTGPDGLSEPDAYGPGSAIRTPGSLDSSEGEDQAVLDRNSDGSRAGGNPIYRPAPSDSPEQLSLLGEAA